MSASLTQARSLRDRQLDAVREQLLDATMAVIERAEEPTMRAVAAAAHVSERTIYRYFENRDELYKALQPRFVGRAGIPLPERADQLEEYVHDLFTTFEQNRSLVTALVNSSWAAPFLRATRSRNLRALRALIDAAFTKASPAERAAAASSLRVVLAGSGWVYLRDAGVSNDDAIAHGQWLVRTLSASLGRGSNHRRSKP